MNLRVVYAAVIRDVRRLRSDPFSLLIWVGIPLVIGVLMNAVFGHGNPAPHGRLLIADEDRSSASAMLKAAFRGDELGKMLTVEEVTRADGRARMDRGEASALLVAGKGLQEAFLAKRPFHLELYTNPSERIAPRLVEEALGSMLDGAFYAQQLSGEEWTPRDLMRLGPRLGKYFNPPLLRVETAVVAQKQTTFAMLFFPSMIFMALMLVANGMAGEIWKEQAMGTLRRLATTPAPLWTFLAGRLVFVAGVLGVVGISGLAAARFIAGVPVANFAGGVLWVAACGTGLFLLLLLVALQASNRRSANVIGNLLIFPLALVGGCFFPFAVMPAWMESIGRFTPNGWAVGQFQNILEGSAAWRSIAWGIGGMLAAGGLAFAMVARRLRGGFLA